MKIPSERGLVAPGFMVDTIAGLVSKIESKIEEEQRKTNPDNALVLILCDSVRMAREYVYYVRTTIERQDVEETLNREQINEDLQ